MAETFEPVSGGSAPFFKFDTKGKKIKGKLIGRRTIASDMSKTGTQDVIDILTTEGEYTVALLSDLKKKVAKIADGDLVSIEYVDTKKTKGGPSPMKIFNVLRATAPTADAPF
jgi:translation initiation factor IF-1